MYGLSVGKVPNTGRTVTWYDLSPANGVFVKAFDPYSYNMRHADSNRVFASGGYTSTHYANPKESVMELTVFGSWQAIRGVFAKLPPNRDLIFRWFDTDDLAAAGVKYLYGKVVDVRSGVSPGQTTGSTSDWTDATVRVRCVDPHIYTDYKQGTFSGVASPSRTDPLAFRTEVSAASNDMVSPSISTVEHPPEFLRLESPTVAGQTIVHTLSIPETDTSCSVTFAGDGNDFRYTLWNRFGDDLRFTLASGGMTTKNDQIWDGGVPLIPAGEPYHLVHTIAVTVPAGVTDPSTYVVLPDPNDDTAIYMSWWVHRLGRIL